MEKQTIKKYNKMICGDWDTAMIAINELSRLYIDNKNNEDFIEEIWDIVEGADTRVQLLFWRRTTTRLAKGNN